MNLSDARILTRVQSGDREAYLHLFERYYARVESYARAQLQDVETAREVASETFARAYRAVDTFRRDDLGYLCCLLKICRQLISSERARHRVVPPFSRGEAVVQTACLPDRTKSQERRSILRNALDRLSVDDREIILLSFEQDLSRRDIAVLLGLPTENAVAMHLCQAMQKLDTILTEQGHCYALQVNSTDVAGRPSVG